MTGHRVAIASHRGGAFLWPENSLTAFRATAGLALEQVECDVHASAEGEPIVIHDALLDRTTDGRGPVAACTAAELAEVRIRGLAGETLPTLSQMLEICRGSPVAPRIEIKADAAGRPYPGLVGRVGEALDRAALRQTSWIIAFDAGTAAEAMAAGGFAGVAWLLEGATLRAIGLRGALAVAQRYGFPEIGVHEAALDTEANAAFRQAGIRVSVWGANHAPSIRRMLGLGIDVLTTDDPPLAIALRG